MEPATDSYQLTKFNWLGAKIMTTVTEYPFRRLSRADGWRVFRNLVGGALILAVWLALWTWLAAGVVRPLSSVPRLQVERAAVAERA